MEIISKTNAQLQGLDYYFTGKPCRAYGERAVRSVTTGRCQCEQHKERRNELSRIRMRKYWEENKEEINQKRRESYYADVELSRLYARVKQGERRHKETS